MKAPITRSRRVKLQSGSTGNKDSRHELFRQQQRILVRKSDATGANNLAGGQDSNGDNVHDMASLIWKYFADEIRETLIEVQTSVVGLDDILTHDS